MRGVVLLALCALATGAQAQEGVTKISARAFLTGEPPRNAVGETADVFLPLNSVEWIWDIVRADPVIGAWGAVVSVERMGMAPANLFGPNGSPVHHGDAEGVPEHFRHPDLRVEVGIGAAQPFVRYLYMPKQFPPQYLVSCAADIKRPDRDWIGCGFRATYTPDPAITFVVRLYRPGPPATFDDRHAAIAARVREVGACLDAIDTPPATRTEIDLRVEAHPKPENCAMDMRS